MHLGKEIRYMVTKRKEIINMSKDVRQKGKAGDLLFSKPTTVCNWVAGYKWNCASLFLLNWKIPYWRYRTTEGSKASGCFVMRSRNAFNNKQTGHCMPSSQDVLPSANTRTWIGGKKLTSSGLANYYSSPPSITSTLLSEQSKYCRTQVSCWNIFCVLYKLWHVKFLNVCLITCI